MLRTSIVSSQAYRWGGLALFVAAAVIVSALGIEHIGDIRPCPLCLQQRWAYYAALPLLFAALVLLSAEAPRTASAIFFMVAIAFLANAGLGVYHAGAEWKYWPGPDTCAAGGAVSAGGNLLEAMAKAKVVRCDEPALIVAGLSLAGWNVIASILLMIAALKAAFAAAEHERYL